MPQINLLPWREDLRKTRLRDFFVIGGICMALAAAAVVGVHVFYEGRIGFQERRNSMLQAEIAKLDKKIEQIKDLEREKELLLARMRIIEQLQTSRPEVVKVVDQLANRLPDGVFYTRISQKKQVFNLQGVAQSNARVSSLMRGLDDSPQFVNPKLLEIKASKGAATSEGDVRFASFKLEVRQKQLAELKAPEPDTKPGKKKRGKRSKGKK